MFSKKHLLLFSVYVIGNDYLALMIFIAAFWYVYFVIFCLLCSLRPVDE